MTWSDMLKKTQQGYHFIKKGYVPSFCIKIFEEHRQTESRMVLDTGFHVLQTFNNKEQQDAAISNLSQDPSVIFVD